MRLEDMKSDIPETPDFIHKMIQNEGTKTSSQMLLLSYSTV